MHFRSAGFVGASQAQESSVLAGNRRSRSATKEQDGGVLSAGERQGTGFLSAGRQRDAGFLGASQAQETSVLAGYRRSLSATKEQDDIGRTSCRGRVSVSLGAGPPRDTGSLGATHAHETHALAGHRRRPRATHTHYHTATASPSARL